MEETVESWNKIPIIKILIIQTAELTALLKCLASSVCSRFVGVLYVCCIRVVEHIFNLK